MQWHLKHQFQLISIASCMDSLCLVNVCSEKTVGTVSNSAGGSYLSWKEGICCCIQLENMILGQAEWPIKKQLCVSYYK